ncbi:hypothetical protein GMRT_10272 [Giardia muris]|uniref:Uncharacterized protein n=1 Tax=Giardia muris TaxID=5742 RepID=A0A4Z1SU85_GIAMU|nr:hypothetical protein GMRT_10272 [Giardia muris]|eukprot:TNJ29436.1 hypothetical protein GMRT_10272 [Giardia muris]
MDVFLCYNQLSTIIPQVSSKLEQLHAAIERRDHYGLISLVAMHTRSQLVMLRLKYQARYGVQVFDERAFKHSSFGGLSVSGSRVINDERSIYESGGGEGGEGGDEGCTIIPASQLYGELLRGYFTSTAYYGAECIYNSLYECEDDPDFYLIVETLCSAYDSTVVQIIDAYKVLAGGRQSLVDDIRGFLSKNVALYTMLEALLTSAEYRCRYLSKDVGDDSLVTDEHILQKAKLLQDATNGFVSPEATFQEIILLSSPRTLRLIDQKFRELARTSLEEALGERFAGITKYALRLRLIFALDPKRCYATILHSAITENRDSSILATFLNSTTCMSEVDEQYCLLAGRPLRPALRRLFTGRARALALAIFDECCRRESQIGEEIA